MIKTGAVGHALFLGTFETSSNWQGWDVYPHEIFDDAQAKARIESLHRSFVHTSREGTLRIRETDQEFTRLAIDRMRAHPIQSLWTWMRSIPRLWYQDYIPMYRDREASGTLFIFYLVFAAYAYRARHRAE